MDSRTVVLLGGGTDSIGIISRVKEMGLRTIVMDQDTKAPGLALADYRAPVSCYDADLARWALKRFEGDGLRPDAILCAGTDAPHVMADVAATHGFVGPSRRTAELSRRKDLQHSCLRAAHIQAPPDLGEWLVVKPTDSRGGRGVSRVRADNEAGLAVAKELAARFGSGVIVLGWVDGIQLSTESLVQDGKVLWTSFAERNYSRLEEFAPAVIEDGSDVPPSIPRYHELDYEQICEATLQRCVEAIELRNGTLKGDLVWTGQDAVVIEVATRLSGGRFCSDTTPMVWGVDFVGMAVRIALGERIYPGEIRPYFRGHVCQRYYFPLGKTITCHPDRGPTVIARGQTREEARANAERELARIREAG